MDEQPRLPGPRSDEPALARAGLQGARDRSPDRPDAPSRLPSPVDGRRRPVAHDIRFQVHPRSEEHTSELQSLTNLVCRLLLEKKNCGASVRYWAVRSCMGRGCMVE